MGEGDAFPLQPRMSVTCSLTEKILKNKESHGQLSWAEQIESTERLSTATETIGVLVTGFHVSPVTCMRSS